MADDLDGIETRARQATSGPWQVLHDPRLDCVWLNAASPGDHGAIALFDYRGGQRNLADAQFAAHARQDVVALVAEVRNLRARVEELLEANSREVERRIQAERVQAERSRPAAGRGDGA